MPFTWNIHNFTYNPPRILTISLAIYLKYTRYKRFFYDIKNFVANLQEKFRSLHQIDLENEQFDMPLPELVTISHTIHLDY